MAYTTVLKGNYCDVLFGDGAVTEVFTQLCGMSTRGLSITYASAFEGVDYDCADPEAIAITLREVGAQDWSISGSGFYNRGQQTALRDLLGTTGNYRFRISEDAADNIDDGYWQGRAFISAYEVTGNDGENAQISITITGAGLIEWTAAV